MKLQRWKALVVLAMGLMLVSGGASSDEISDLSITEASNTARFPEGQAPSTVNDGARELESILARWYQDTNCNKASTGSSNTYAFAANQTISSYYDGLTICFDANFANTGNATLNVDTVGAATIMKRNDQTLESGDIEAGQKVSVVYDGTNWQMLSVAALTPLDSGDIGSTVQAYDADTLKADTSDDLTAGFTSTSIDSGTKSSGTFTPAFATGNIQRYVNGGAHTLAPPSTGEGTMVIQVTNDGSAGTVTTSGFTVVTGDTITTTNGDDFLFYITVVNSFSQLNVVALQ